MSIRHGRGRGHGVGRWDLLGSAAVFWGGPCSLDKDTSVRGEGCPASNSLSNVLEERNGICCGLCPPNPCVEALTPSVMLSAGGASGR